MADDLLHALPSGYRGIALESQFGRSLQSYLSPDCGLHRDAVLSEGLVDPLLPQTAGVECGEPHRGMTEIGVGRHTGDRHQGDADVVDPLEGVGDDLAQELVHARRAWVAPLLTGRPLTGHPSSPRAPRPPETTTRSAPRAPAPTTRGRHRRRPRRTPVTLVATCPDDRPRRPPPEIGGGRLRGSA